MATLRVCGFAGGVKAKSQRVAVTGGPGGRQRRVGPLGGSVGANNAGARQRLCRAEARHQISVVQRSARSCGGPAP